MQQMLFDIEPGHFGLDIAVIMRPLLDPRIAHESYHQVKRLLDSKNLLASPLPFTFISYEETYNEFHARCYHYSRLRYQPLAIHLETDNSFSFAADGDSVIGTLYALGEENISSSAINTMMSLNMFHRYLPPVTASKAGQIILSTPLLILDDEQESQILELRTQIAENRIQIERLTFLTQFNVVERGAHTYDLRPRTANDHFIEALPNEERRRERTFSRCIEHGTALERELASLNRLKQERQNRALVFERVGLQKVLEDIVDFISHSFNIDSDFQNTIRAPHMDIVSLRQSSDLSKIFLNMMKSLVLMAGNENAPPALNIEVFDVPAPRHLIINEDSSDDSIIDISSDSGISVGRSPLRLPVVQADEDAGDAYVSSGDEMDVDLLADFE